MATRTRKTAAKAEPKKAPARKTAATAAKTTTLVKWEDRLAARAARVAKVEKPSSSGTPTISLADGVMSVDDVPVPGNEMEVVVLVALHANEFYTEAYTPGRVAVPVCYAYGDSEHLDPEAEMAPHEDAEDPQSDKCATCPLNQWGSADTGRAKACKNQRRLAVIAADALDSAEKVAAAEVRLLKVSPSNIKNWNSYVNTQLVPAELPEFGVVTRAALTGAYKLTFSAAGLIDFNADPERAEALLRKVEEAEAIITKPWPTQAEMDERAEEEKPVARGRKKSAAPKKFAKR